MSHSRSYRTIGLASFGQFRDSLRDPCQVYRNTNFSLGTRGKLHALHIISRRVDSQDSIKEVGHIPTTPQEEPFLNNQYVRGTLNLLCTCSGYRDSLNRKKVGFPCSGLNAGSFFFSQYKGMSEYSVQSPEKTLYPTSSGQGASDQLTLREAHGVQYFERGRGLTLLEK